MNFFNLLHRRTILQFLSIVLLLTCVIPLIWPGLSPFEIHLDSKNLPPNLSHWMGTDELGRDVFARVSRALLTSLSVGALAVLLDALFGMTLGCIAALKSKKWDHLITSLMDIFEGVPDLLIAAVVAFALGNHPLSLAIAISITGWVPMARLTRSVVFSIKDKEFILASYRWGATHRWVITKHVLPSCRSTLATGLILRLRSALFAEAFLGFLGLGIPDPYPSLGSLCAQGVHALLFYPWRVCFALMAIACSLLCFTWLSEELDQKNGIRPEAK